MKKDIIYMQEAIKEAKKAYKIDDVPIGAIIVYDDEIIAKAHNQKESTNNAIKHAEIIAIEKACKKLKTWHLEKCKLYTTLEPCLMCMGAIMQARIKNIYYATDSDLYGSINKLDEKTISKMRIHNGICKDESIELLKNFFKSKRV